MTKEDAAKLVEQFVETIIKLDESVFVCNVESTKYIWNRYAPIVEKIMGMGEEARDQFASLLEHPCRLIRVAAAVYLYSSRPEQTLAAMREVAKGDDFAAFCAQRRIKEWEKRSEQSEQ